MSGVSATRTSSGDGSTSSLYFKSSIESDKRMQGGGIDMYDLIPNLHEYDKELYSTNQKFWVGVIEGMFPSPPVPRRKTRSYAAAKVYQYGSNKVFGMHAKNEQGFYMEFYKIPKREWMFIQ